MFVVDFGDYHQHLEVTMMHSTKTCTAVLGACIATLTSFYWLASANLAVANTAPSRGRATVNAKPVVRGGPTSGRSPGGSRGECVATNGSKARSSQELLSLNADTTTTTHPTFFFYVPDGAEKGQFMLQDDQGRTIEKSELNLTGKAGIIGVGLSRATAPGLQAGKRYAWVFALTCKDAPDGGANPYWQGVMTNTGNPTSLVNQFTQAPPRDRMNLYQKADALLWQDALIMLANLRRANPENVTVHSAWNQLLNAGGFTQIATAPLL